MNSKLIHCTHGSILSSLYIKVQDHVLVPDNKSREKEMTKTENDMIEIPTHT